jgi:charged multivesicular body protein 2A
MAFLFGGSDGSHIYKPKNPIKETQSELRAAMRVISREASKLTEQEKPLMREIKLLAANNKHKQCETKAKELIRLRNHHAKLQLNLNQITGLTQNLSSMSNTQVIQDCIIKTEKILKTLNKKTDISHIMKTMNSFQLQNEQFNIKQETLQETMDSVMEIEDEDTVTDEMVGNIYRDLGIDASLRLATSFPNLSKDEQSLASRLAALKTPQFQQ